MLVIYIQKMPPFFTANIKVKTLPFYSSLSKWLLKINTRITMKVFSNLKKGTSINNIPH